MSDRERLASVFLRRAARDWDLARRGIDEKPGVLKALEDAAIAYAQARGWSPPAEPALAEPELRPHEHELARKLPAAGRGGVPMRWCDDCNGYHPRPRLTVAESSALWCLAQVGLIITLGVLATRLNDYASCPVEPYHGTPIHTSEEIQGVLWAALEPVQRRS